MPRGKKNLTPDEKIEKFQKEIEATEEKLAELKQQLVEAQKEKEEQEVYALYKEIRSRGMTIQEAAEKLKA